MPNQGKKRKKEIFSPSDVMTLSVPLWVFDVDHSKIVWANDSARDLWHAETFEELFAREMASDMSDSISARLKQYQSSFSLNDKAFHEVWTLYPNNLPVTYNVRMSRHNLPDGRIGMLCEAKAQEHRTPHRLRSAEALNHIPVCISLFSMAGDLLYMNTEANKKYGVEAAVLQDRFDDQSDYQTITSDLRNNKSASLICRVVCGENLRWHELSATACHDPTTGEETILLSEFDVTGLKEQEQKVRFLAHHDLLTGLYSRNYVNQIFPIQLSDALKAQTPLAMLLIDLDNFKAINDTLGHVVGDRLLIYVAALLESIVGSHGQIARLGGDEFVILMPYQYVTELETICHRILVDMSSDCTFDDHIVNSKASIGVSLFPEHGRDLSSLMQHADLALYEAKDAGRNTHRYFRPELQKAALVKRTLEKELTLAIERKEFELFYQPRVDCQKQTVLSAEALMRWHHPQKGIVLPGDFIEALEETGLIHQAGDWIIEQAGKDQRRLAKSGYDFPLSINISPKQFERSDFVLRLQENLAKTGCPTDRIEIELTEGMLMGEGYDAKSILTKLCDVGFSIAIDDFGTGYSNLAYIQDYPISSLKVDRSFMQMIDDQSPVIGMILSLCRLVSVTAVAEGVETIGQLEWLQLNHCNQYQGFLYSKPLPLTDLFGLLKDPPQLVTGTGLVEGRDMEISWAV
ncbi:hypothetical protein C0081_04650 [Cohaesibacter celericrescens]|uniref:GGDEF-domain containing protein n=2 Tax=Cohaesibacter celericrescens TaxID=2067669 RepID=A0A2N5XVE2_9HYPH|nr:hypothetical protein C0081_04650 [Cohaesibacter celericrescens]